MKTWVKIAIAVVIAPFLAVAVYHVATPGRGSLSIKLAALVIQTRGKPLADAVTFRKTIETRTPPAPAPLPDAMKASFVVRNDSIGAMKVITLTPKANASRWTIVYTHGGAYVNDLSGPHWDVIAALSQATGATVIVPIYPLAPEHTNRDAFPLLETLYRRLIATRAPANIAFAGDSAGAGLALGQAVELRAKGLPLPARIILFSPWLDLTLADPQIRAIEPQDVMLGVDALRLCGKWWAAGEDPRLPQFSPLYADLKGLPPIDLFQGSRDIFVVDARTFTARAKAAGTRIQYAEYPGAFHVFVGATFTPEAKDVFRRISTSLPRRGDADPVAPRPS